MNPSHFVRLLPGKTLAALVFSLGLVSQSVEAQNYWAPPPGYNNYPQQEQGSLQRIGANVGNFFKRVFYGQPTPVYGQMPAGYGYPRYSLDAPASAYPQAQNQGQYAGYAQQPAQPQSNHRYQYAPIEQAPAHPQQAKTAQKSVNTSHTTSKPAKTVASTPKPATKRYTPASPSKVQTQTQSIASEPKSSATAPVTYQPEKKTAPAPKEPAPTQVAENKIQETPPPSYTPEPETTISPTLTDDTIDLSPKSNASESKDSVPGTKTFLVGRRADKPGRVISPYAPYNELDVTGLPSGSLALDPTTQKVFQVP